MGLRPSPGVIGVLVVLAAACAAFVLAGHPRFVVEHFALRPRLALGREPWQLLTSALVHVNLSALLSSAIGIWLFGTPVEQRGGRGYLFRLLVGASVCGALASAALGRLIAPDALVAGAGPAAMACIAGFGTIYGRTPLMLFGMQPIKASTCALIFLGISGVMYVVDADWLGLVGGAAGAAFGAYGAGSFGRLIAAFDRVRLWRVRRRYRVLSGGRDTKRYLN